MSRKTLVEFVEKAVGLLVAHFGVENVRAALAKVSPDSGKPSGIPPGLTVGKSGRQSNPSILSILELLQQKDAEKHALLSDFYSRLKNGDVLRESQDIRQFAQLIGIKELRGKSRKDFIPTLMRFLLERPTADLKTDIDRAATVSEFQRQQGFSVLTDKLLGTNEGVSLFATGAQVMKDEKSNWEDRKNATGLRKTELDVLKYFFDEDRNMTAGEIASHFRMHSSAAKRSIDILLENNCLERRQNLTELHTSGNTDGFVITAIGRYAVEEVPHED